MKTALANTPPTSAVGTVTRAASERRVREMMQINRVQASAQSAPSSQKTQATKAVVDSLQQVRGARQAEFQANESRVREVNLHAARVIADGTRKVTQTVSDLISPLEGFSVGRFLDVHA